MALRIRMGQYYPGDSPIHRLDPRAKVTAALAVMVSVFAISTPLQLAFGFAFALALLALAQVPAHKVLESIRPLVAMLLVLGLVNLLVNRSGEVVWRLGVLAITTGGLRAAFVYSLRLVIAVVAAALMLLTTTPTQLTDAFDAGLAPLARLGLPGHELAMVFSLMLRFIPTLADETQSILDAQASRGGRLLAGSPVRRIRAVGAILVALLASSIHHAEGLSRALDARCYEGGAERSHWHPLHMRGADWLAVGATTAYVAALVALGLTSL
ncbi:energy-coupling factor transporter transmembrane component T family protein [Olsenella phocaeensis]|uniref:energy-coupling factor transporter transmembrane component T family protein n=1 Tax=Olsenella phocaeensis TaxID=1852385 RepID=UPI003A8FD3E2